MKKIYIFSLSLVLIAMLSTSCKKIEKAYLFEVDNVEVTQPGVDKNSLKNDQEFISLAYSDLFGTTLTENQLLSLSIAYNSMGDKNLIADVIVRNFLKDPAASVPTTQTMLADIDKFIDETYKRFYVREPSEYERWYFTNLIESDPDMTPELIYYGFLTSDEYRYF